MKRHQTHEPNFNITYSSREHDMKFTLPTLKVVCK